MKPRIGYAGLSHLGVCSAAAAAAAGFQTVGFDPDPALAARVASGEAPVFEPGLEALLAANAGRLTFTADPAALAACDLIYVARDVATDDSGNSDLAAVDGLIAIVAAAARPDAALTVLCQVPPGFTRARGRPERPLHYQVETLVFGIAVERATKPERFIVGLPDPAAGLPPAMAAFLGAFGCPILPMRLESAELAKMSINICLAASVTVANTLAGIAERAGADWREIVPALKLDARIGPKAYLDAGLGLAGGNIERDVTALRGMAQTTGAEAGLLAAIAANSAHNRDWALRALHAALPVPGPDTTVAVLGLAYKPDTRSIKNSAGVALARHLRGWRLRAHDPLVDVSCLGDPGAQGFADPLEAARGADAVVVTTPWAAYRAIDPAALARAMRGRVVIDPYRVLDASACARAGLAHRVLGAA
jgi:UDPglucose 6-dehydrogenase